MFRRLRLTLIQVTFATLCAASASAVTPTPTPGPAPLLIAIDNISAIGATRFSTDFGTFASGTLAENLTVSGITFTPDPPGSWEIAGPRTPPFTSPFRTLTGNVLQQPSEEGTLVLTFASPVTSFSCAFALNAEIGTAGLKVQGFSGTTLVGTTVRLTTIGTTVGEGSVNFSSATAFDKVRLSAVVGAPTPTPTATTGSGTGSRNPTPPCCAGTPRVDNGGLAPAPSSGCAIAAHGESSSFTLSLGAALLVVIARGRRHST